MEIIRERFTQQLKELEEDLLNMTNKVAKCYRSLLSLWRKEIYRKSATGYCFR